MTIALMPDGGLYPNWGGRNFSCPPDFDKTLTFAANMQAFYKDTAKAYLYDGRMIAPRAFTVTEAPHYGDCRDTFPAVFSTAWEKNGKQAQIFVNPNDAAVTLTMDGKTLTVPSMDAVLVEL